MHGYGLPRINGIDNPSTESINLYGLNNSRGHINHVRGIKEC